MPDSMTALAAVGLSHSYDGAEVLTDVSLAVRFGEILAVTGPNGSGKSTLVEVLAGALRPRRGAVTAYGDRALVVQRPEAPAGLPVTAADVFMMGLWKRPGRPRSRAREAVADALDRVGMREWAAVPLSTLSGGQRQRVFLAQGIVRAPDILLLDEPAAGLDRASVERTRAILVEESARGAAVVHVTHDARAEVDADRIIALRNGRIER